MSRSLPDRMDAHAAALADDFHSAECPERGKAAGERLDLCHDDCIWAAIDQAIALLTAAAGRVRHLEMRAKR